ncbi:DNA polymerase III, beta subunit [Thermodesulfobium narugense DSM 14796]|uniref:Beta sliding clamp n=1 Tax=Thermodesulfobium narugense DSM 14796 TaxID=747365 RepID=M1E5I9_9BACT|nr:DNA polymerase III subunit beta [Thermodesulfobium narugense]AEE13655.1 DNA polymerase III, beta subunit [Thermodesulfobium narugense DSM 14796]
MREIKDNVNNQENQEKIRLELQTKELNKIIQDLSKNIKKHPVEILRNIQISAQDKHIIFRSTDLEVEITYFFETEQEIKIDPILIESNELSNLIKNYPNEKINFEFQNEKLIIEGEDLSATIPLKQDPNFPDPIDTSKAQPKSINFNLIKQAIEKVISSSSQSSDSKMSGVNFKTKEKTLTIAATDGFRLAIFKINLDEEIDMNFTISKKCAQEVIKFDATVPISYQTQTHWVLSTHEKMLSVKKLNYEYPNYEKAIPSDNKYKFYINREDFIKKLIFTSSQSEIVKISLKDNTLNIQSSDSRIKTKTLIKSVEEVKDIEFLFKSSYLIDGLKIFDEEEVLFTYKDENKPITLENNINTTYITLPARPER